MRLAVVLATVTIILNFVTDMAANRYGPPVANRFLERERSYTAEALTRWIAVNPAQVRGYVVPVLFPCDLLFLLALGGFLASASVACAGTLPTVRGIAIWFLLLPVAYVLADLVEDLWLAWLLLSPDWITQAAVALARFITKAKLVACTLALVQTLALAALAWCRG